MRILKNRRIRATIQIEIPSLVALLNEEGGLKEDFKIAHSINNPEGIPGLPNQKSITIRASKLDIMVHHQVFTFTQTLDECLGNFVTLFQIIPSQENEEDSVLFLAYKLPPEKDAANAYEFFSRLYDRIMASEKQ